MREYLWNGFEIVNRDCWPWINAPAEALMEGSARKRRGAVASVPRVAALGALGSPVFLHAHWQRRSSTVQWFPHPS